MYHKTEFIVLKRINYSDNHRILTLLSPEKGKFTAIAKGTRSLTSKLALGIELFCHSKGTFAEGKSMDVLTQVALVEYFAPLRQDFETISRALYLLELCATVAQEDHDQGDLFSLLLQTLDGLSRRIADSTMLLYFFEMHLLSILGFQPQLYTCAQCVAPLTREVAEYAVTDHGIICKQCLFRTFPALDEYPLQRVSFEQLMRLQELQTMEWADVCQPQSFLKEIRDLPGLFLSSVLGREMRTRQFFSSS
ncbi:MAG: DNA repair protein RecO [bacterium]